VSSMKGWLLDINEEEPGIVAVWIRTQSGATVKLLEKYEPYFYIFAPSWKLDSLSNSITKPGEVSTSYEPVLTPQGKVNRMLLVRTKSDISRRSLVKSLMEQDVSLFNADISLEQQYLFERHIFPFARIDVCSSSNSMNFNLRDDIESLDFDLPRLREATLDVRTSKPLGFGELIEIGLSFPDGFSVNFDPKDPESLIELSEEIQRKGVDLLFTEGGDGRVLPSLIEVASKLGIRNDFTLNRDLSPMSFRRGGFSYVSYGTVGWKSKPALLRGRYHIDLDNFMAPPDGGLQGLFEFSRVCSVPAQRMARMGIGSIMSALEALVAFRRQIAIPTKEAAPEHFKNALSLIKSDRGGFVMNPKPGIHEDVLEVDFTSLYPSIIAVKNISAETVDPSLSETPLEVPEINFGITANRFGIVSDAVAFLLRRRMSYLSKSSCEDDIYDARQKAIKLVLCAAFGYLGFKKAKFGRVDAHMATTAFARDILLKAIRLAETKGFEVVHAIVDALWIKGGTDREKNNFISEISEAIGIPAKAKANYRWIAFLRSRANPDVPVPTRYFGVLREGKSKMRGIEARRHDTPQFIAETQIAMLEAMANVDLPKASMAALHVLTRSMSLLMKGEVPINSLVITRRLSKSPWEYRNRIAQALVAWKVKKMGIELMPGMELSFVMTENGPSTLDFINAPLDLRFYRKLLLRASHSILEPFHWNPQSIEFEVQRHSLLSPFLIPDKR